MGFPRLTCQQRPTGVEEHIVKSKNKMARNYRHTVLVEGARDFIEWLPIKKQLRSEGKGIRRAVIIEAASFIHNWGVR